MHNWYLLYCKTGQLWRAYRNLESQGVDCLAPLIHTEKLISGKRTTVTEPMFPDYLFVKFDINQIHTSTIRSTRGVRYFVRFGALPIPIPAEVIQQLCASQPVAIDPSVPCQGDNVMIIHGKFAGLEAIFSEPEGEKRSILLLNFINKQQQIIIKNTCFKKV